MGKFKLKSLPCYECGLKQIKLISRANWVCQNCGKDNSLFVVYAYEAIEPPINRGEDNQEKGKT